MPGNDKPELPLNAERSVSVRSELQHILDSDAFKGGKRAQDFLQLIVEHALAGRFDQLRERMIGVEMFGRPVDYDTGNDAVVRVKANEVRRRLAQYYQNLTASTPVRIELSAGSYVPQFLFESSSASSSEEPDAPKPVTVTEVSTSSAQRSWSSRRLLLVLAVAVTLFLAVFLILRWNRSPRPHPIRSIAILPLVNFSGDSSHDYFADGMTDELTADLSQISSLRVISRTSTMTYKATHKTIPEIGKELKVDAIVEGSVEREGNKIRVVTQLIDSETDQHIWAHTYDRDMTSVLELQSDIARSIADQIRIELTPAEQTRLSRTQHADPKAVELYLQARHKEDLADPLGALDDLRSAVQVDPNYASAHAALAEVYGWMGEGGWMPYAQAFTSQKSEALKAIAMDDSRAEPHLELAAAAMDKDWDWATQRKELQRALDLNPNSAAVVAAYANYLCRIGHCKDGLVESAKALSLDPVSSRAYLGASFVSYYCRQYNLALEQEQNAVQLPHRVDEAYFPLGVIYVEKGMYNEAIEQFRNIGDMPHALGHLGNVYARLGNTQQAYTMIEKLKQHIAEKGIGRYEVALVYAGLHQNDNAFAWLEKAFQAQDKGLTYLRIDPCLDPLRSDPRFAELVKRVGIPD